MPPGTRFTMERLVLLVIAVIGLHTAFVLYMADIRRVDPKAGTVRTAPERTVLKPTVDSDLRASITPPAAESSPAPLVTGHTDRVRSRAPRVSPVVRTEVKSRRQLRRSDSAKPVPAIALRASSGARGFKKSFGKYVVAYTTDIGRPARGVTTVSPSTTADNFAPKRKKNSFVAKLQLVYKKPWDLIKAVGSKLR